MKLKSLAAAAVSAALTLCSMSAYAVSDAETTEQLTYTVTFNIYDEGVTVEDPTVFEPIEIAAGECVYIPDGQISLDGYIFSGWTYDDVYLYRDDDFFKMPENDIVLEPVWIDKTSQSHTLSYNIEGDGYEILNENSFSSLLCRPGQAVTVTTASIMRDGYYQMGWTYNGYVFNSASKMIMPDCDVVLEPNWCKLYNVYYEAGDVDKVTGTHTFIFQKCETLTFDLADSSRITRLGYNLSGWLSDVDGQIYKTGSQFTMPSSEVHFTAVWTPKSYTVVFKSNNGKSQTIKITGETDTAIEVPECTFTYSGYEFAGWEYEGTVYKPGDEFIIPGALPGLGISLNAVWTEPRHDDSLTLAQARKMYSDGEITADELLQTADFVLGK